MPRPKKGARIYKRPGRVGYYAYVNAANRDIPLGTDDEGEAHTRLAELLHNCRPHRVSEGTPNATIFKECLDRAETAHTQKTWYEVSLNLERIGKWLESRNVFDCERVTQGLVEDYKTARHRFEKKSAARVNRELDTWKKAMLVAVEFELQPASCLNWFRHIREARPEPHQRGLSRVEIHKILRATKLLPYRALFRLTVGTGLRDDEVRHLEPGDLREDRVVVTPKPPGACTCCPKGWSSKSYRYRNVPASPETLEAAKLYLSHKANMNLDQKRIWNVLDQACTDAKVAHVSMHDFRRACASHWLAEGLKIELISKWLGHRDIMTTMRYLRIVETEIPKASKLPW